MDSRPQKFVSQSIGGKRIDTIVLSDQLLPVALYFASWFVLSACLPSAFLVYSLAGILLTRDMSEETRVYATSVVVGMRSNRCRQSLSNIWPSPASVISGSLSAVTSISR